MNYKKIRIIINPSSGKPDPVLHLLNQWLQEHDGTWDIQITQKQGDAQRFTKDALKSSCDLIISYGGDGTVMEVAQVLMNTNTPLLILPGGSANVMAKELQLPSTIPLCLDLLDKRHRIRNIDMGLMNETPFLLRISTGVAANLVLNTSPEEKTNLGQLAYTVSTLREITQAKEALYTVEIDTKKETIHGTSLFILNTAHTGLTPSPFLPHVQIDDGFLDLVVMKASTLTDIPKALTDAFFDEQSSETIVQRRFSEATVELPSNHRMICDDAEAYGKRLQIKVVPKALRVVVPYET